MATTDPATICAPGYARSHRPSHWYAATVKLVMAFPDSPARYELDHQVPLCLGGAGWSLANLQLQPWDEARRKDAAERAACKRVCERGYPLAAEQWYFREQDRW